MGTATARDSISLDKDTLLHAGPGLDNLEEVPSPILNSAKVAAVYEGLCDNFAAAEKQITAGKIRLMPAQDYDVVTPLAAVVSSSMHLHKVLDVGLNSGVAWAPLNGGSGVAPRLGICSEAALSHLSWMHDSFAPILAQKQKNEIDLIDIAQKAIQKGDDCHGRTPVGTSQLLEQLINDGVLSKSAYEAYSFIANGPSFFLNLWMAACKCMLNAARNINDSTLVISAGANGIKTGIQIAASPDQWFTAPASVPNGLIKGAETGLGAIGDSAIVDNMGFGAMAMPFAPEQKQLLGSFMPPNTESIGADLLSVIDTRFNDLQLPIGLTARACVDTGTSPVVSLGILDAKGEAGRVGGGIFTQPLALYQNAVEWLDAS